MLALSKRFRQRKWEQAGSYDIVLVIVYDGVYIN